MMVSVASIARVSAPETGASSSVTPRWASSGASDSVSQGSEELMSTTIAPSGSASATPPSRTASRTTLPLGSIVTTTGTPANA